MKKTIRIILALAALCPTGIRAQEIEAGEESAAAKLESKFVKLEESMAALTAKVEEEAFEEKRRVRESETAAKDAAIRLEEMGAELAAAKKKIAAYDVEMENLRNTAAYLKDQITALESRASGAPKAIGIAADANPPKDDSALIVAPAPAPAPETPDDKAYKEAKKAFESKDWAAAAIAFADNMRDYPEGANFYNNLAGLGLSFAELGNGEKACKAFATITSAKEKEEVGLEVQKIAIDKSAELKCGEAVAAP
jgi:TolA-binding protein